MEEEKSDVIPEEEEIEQEEQETLEPAEEEAVEESEEESEEAPDEIIPEEPPVRKSAKDFIIERKQRKIEKLERERGYEEEGEDPDPRAIIREEISKAIEPLANVFKTQTDETELQDALNKYPEAKKIESAIRKYASSPAYSNVPIDFIVRGLLGAKANVEAQKEQANEEAKRTRMGGSSRRPKEIKEKTAWDMSDAEFEKEVSKALRSR